MKPEISGGTDYSATAAPGAVPKGLADYRILGFDKRSPAQVVYQSPFLFCPWPGCSYRIDGIHFQLEKWADANNRDRLLAAWWKGSGLIARCPGCGKYVQFGLDGKRAIATTKGIEASLLPDNWAETCHIVSKMDTTKQANKTA